MSNEIELQPGQTPEIKRDDSSASRGTDTEVENEEKRQTTDTNVEEGLEGQSLSAPINETQALQQWNKPRINLWRYMATLLGFVIMGMNDAAIGVSSYRFIFGELFLG